MKLRNIIFICFFFFPSMVFSSQSVITTHCQEEWGNDLEMFRFCVKEQNAALISLKAFPTDEISKRCAQEWPSQYDMQVFCASERRASKANIEQQYSGQLRTQCEREWGTEYEMVEFCIEEGDE